MALRHEPCPTATVASHQGCLFFCIHMQHLCCLWRPLLLALHRTEGTSVRMACCNLYVDLELRKRARTSCTCATGIHKHKCKLARAPCGRARLQLSKSGHLNDASSCCSQQILQRCHLNRISDGLPIQAWAPGALCVIAVSMWLLQADLGKSKSLMYLNSPSTSISP